MNSKPLAAAEIRSSFIQFFADRAHTVVPSAPVAPQDDPTLMFTNAGMNQFKGIFLGENPKGLKRAVDSQKCIRVSGKHNDLEEVGADHYHHTFFEMLGNWSFGDYYKREAIGWAWELLTEVWKIPKERLFVTVYRDDDEAAQLWGEISGLPAERILRFGEKENFWEMGETGPCGPCSEIHYDKGDLSTQAATFADPVEGVNGANERYMEIWNLVFIQYNRNSDGSLTPLKAKSVDTGMGFERLCAVLQGQSSNYATDIFTPIIDEISKRSGVAYDPGAKGMAHRVIADHLRMVAFSIADGVMPSNDGRGYVVRRVLRRGCRYARTLGATKPFLCELVPVLVQQMGEAYPEIAARAHFVEQTIRAEEERFIRALDKGLALFEKVAAEAKKSGGVVGGAEAFQLYDTYGFPLDLTMLLAREEGLTLDEAGFEEAMAAQKARARAARKEGPALADESGWHTVRSGSGTKFLGYEKCAHTAHVMRWRVDEGIAYIVLDESPFYAEMGGEVGETGKLSNRLLELQVTDTVKVNDLWIHKAAPLSGVIDDESMALPFEAVVDRELRDDTRRNHTATHLLHAALRKVLGEEVVQQGSFVGPDALRFDFSLPRAMTPAEVDEVERRVNRQIRLNIEVTSSIQKIDEAKAAGAMALFGEKYDDDVRVISIGDISKELCGGLHVCRTGDIGGFQITVETAIAAGVRRIEAVTGRVAAERARQNEVRLHTLQELLKIKPEELVDRIGGLLQQQRTLEKEIDRLQQRLAAAKVAELAAQASDLSGVKVLVRELKECDSKQFGAVVEQLAASFEGVAVVAYRTAEAGTIAVTVHKSVGGKIKAGSLVSELAILAGGKGGGRPDKAQAGTKSPEKISHALEQATSLIQGMI